MAQSILPETHQQAPQKSAPKKLHGTTIVKLQKIQRARRDLNPRPSGPEPDALSTELRALKLLLLNYL